jgi:hypothetical protein
MSLKLVHDSNVETIPVGNVRDVPEMLRALADDIDGGAHGDVLSLISVIVRPDGLALAWYGENVTAYELMGLFEAAKLRVFADDCVDE